MSTAVSARFGPVRGTYGRVHRSRGDQGRRPARESSPLRSRRSALQSSVMALFGRRQGRSRDLEPTSSSAHSAPANLGRALRIVVAELPLPDLALAKHAGRYSPPATTLVRSWTVGWLVTFDAMRSTPARSIPWHTIDRAWLRAETHSSWGVATHVGLQNTGHVSAVHAVPATGEATPCELNRLSAQESHATPAPRAGVLAVEKDQANHDAGGRRADDDKRAPPHPPSMPKGSRHCPRASAARLSAP